MTLERISRGGLDAVRLTDGVIEIVVAATVGPRVIGLGFVGGANLFAELGDAGLDLPDGSRFSFYGGHRLWVAPEVPESSYDPDDEPVALIETPAGLLIEQPPSPRTGLQKSIELAWGAPGSVELTHRVGNVAGPPVELAPWAITQLTPGGTGILPHGTRQPAGPFQASALVVGWPYTDFGDEGIRIGSDVTLIDGTRSSPTKLGTDLQRGWLAYLLGNEIFIKRARHHAGARYPDRGAAAQIYCNQHFIELETLGPLHSLAAGESVTHTESWQLHRTSRPVSVDDVSDFIERSL